MIDLKDIYKNAEFLGKLGVLPCCVGKTRPGQGYQQSYPQYLGVSSLLHKNQGLSAVSGFNLGRGRVSAQKQGGANHVRAAAA